mgnify:CR=1 FL=1
MPPPPLRLPQNQGPACRPSHHLRPRPGPQDHAGKRTQSHPAQDLRAENQRRQGRQTLNQALGSRDVAPDLVFHSDRGSQYGSKAYCRILEQAEMRQSMSARATPYHNAWTESFMGTLKSEMLQDGCFLLSLIHI